MAGLRAGHPFLRLALRFAIDGRFATPHRAVDILFLSPAACQPLVQWRGPAIPSLLGLLPSHAWNMTAELPAELQSLIDDHITGFNTQNRDLFLSVFGDTAIIIDGIAPYRWLNPDAPSQWLADVETWRKANGVVSEHLSHEVKFWNVEGAHAYAVISGSLTIELATQSIIRTGTLAYTFAKRADAWKIEAQAWGRTA